MPIPLTLNADERRLLQKVVNSHPKAYLRQRAAALLKIANVINALLVGFEKIFKRELRTGFLLMRCLGVLMIGLLRRA